MSPVVWHSLKDARLGLKELQKEPHRTIGSVHTLGALHEGHGKLIEVAAKENDYVVVSVWPNIAQLAPGTKYNYDIETDIQYASNRGATHIINPLDHEMYPDGYSTYLDQHPRYERLDGTVVPFLFKGMITMSFRWILFVRPTRTYWGLKDIGQAILIKQAIDDFNVDTEFRYVPCVRYKSGIAISSRLMNIKKKKIEKFSCVYKALENARSLIKKGVTSKNEVVSQIKSFFENVNLEYFEVLYIKIAKPHDFSEPETISLPFIIHIVVTDGEKNYFEGHLINNEEDLMSGPETIWLREEYPPCI